MNKKQKAKAKQLRGRCPFVTLVGGIGYVCHYQPYERPDNDNRETRRNRLVKCEGCEKVFEVLNITPDF